MTSLARDLPYVRCDANLLEQVLFNLLDNAQKYGAGGRVIVHARPEGANVLVSVTDEGPGIKPTDLERVFEKFYRGGRADGRRAGTGLGLSISRGLIEARIVISMPAVEAREIAKAAS
jgi:two-component system sensor histidine kinase KdpD